MSKRWSLPILALLALLVGLVSLPGCSRYKTFTQLEGFAHFSFEYPSHYEFPSLKPKEYSYGTPVLLYASSGRQQDPFDDKEISVIVTKPDSRARNSEEYLEGYVSFWSSADRFRIVGRYDTQVAGIKGQQIVYSFAHYPGDLSPGSVNLHEVGPPAIARIVFFDYGEVIWMIAVTGRESLADTVKSDFEHIIQTFKILK